VIEDLLNLAPEYQEKVDRLVRDGHLIIGPYYCQPDWRITSGESLIRNLLYGWQDMQRFGGINRIGWLVDTFGHISQAPQLHELFDLDTVFVWRGIPKLEPYFYWQGADGQKLLTINLFGGYRNLYGISLVPEVAIKRLEAEVTRLQPYYPTGDIPLFDGYDLEQNPEDPIDLFRQLEAAIPPNIQIKESAPRDYVQELQGKLGKLPTIAGELISGKYGSVFPGTLSTRTYLKILNRDCEQLLYQLCEPLAVLARFKGRAYNSQQYEDWGRLLLQNAVHDCICGVSIDQVHEKMEYSYQELFRTINEDMRTSLDYILRDFEPGVYAVSTNPFPCGGWQVMEDSIYLLATEGVGVWKITQQLQIERPNEPVTEFEWRNDHYSALVNKNGEVQLGAAKLGHLLITEEKGDTYSDEAGDKRSTCYASGPLIIEQKSAQHCIVRYDCECQLGEAYISTTVRLIFDQTPMVRWQVDLDSRGTNFRIDMLFNTAQSGDIYAGMPFDVVKRPTVDRDLLPRQLNKELGDILLGQRELEEVRTFPFKDFVVISDESSSAVVLAKGIYGYQIDEEGVISLTLRRSIEWLTDPELKNRSGDAGPIMYVPDARCERTVRHEMAVMIDNTTINDLSMHQINGEFQNSPLVVVSHGEGEQSKWQFFQEDIPMSSLSIQSNKLLARVFNPTTREYSLKNKYRGTDVWGRPNAVIKHVPAKTIQTLEIDQKLPEVIESQSNKVLTSVSIPKWRVGENKGLPDPEIIRQIEIKVAQIETETTLLEERLNNTLDRDWHLIRYRYFLLMRELYELRLSVELNKRKLAQQGKLDHDYLYSPDPEIVKLGVQLNEMRIKRRIYDYVVR
ncbi:MAG: hypothetical protein IMY85_02020, partial [Chloroflexi bacterium]|nr:hypothetical protein [Chloroflexota bacterium]